MGKLIYGLEREQDIEYHMSLMEPIVGKERGKATARINIKHRRALLIESPEVPVHKPPSQPAFPVLK
jgi:hypothetical protein